VASTTALVPQGGDTSGSSQWSNVPRSSTTGYRLWMGMYGPASVVGVQFNAILPMPPLS
jgi:hypothetical protein